MRQLERTIQEVRKIRGDLSTWLIHLTKDNFFKSGDKQNFVQAKDCLFNILNTNQLVGVKPIGQFNYKKWYRNVTDEDLKAISFTEAPISEIFLFIGIKYKALNFSSYGLVFDKEELAKPPIFAAPVLYFSQPDGNDSFLKIFNKLEQNHYQDYKDILYLFDKFGKRYDGKDYNFMWEREWRVKGTIKDIRSHVRFGLCPEHDIDFFEKKFPDITFVDPFFNSHQIETKLRQRSIIV